MHTRNHQKLKLLPFTFYLLILNKIVSMNLVAKNSAQRKLQTPWIMKMMQKTTGCVHTNQPLKDNPLLLTPLKCIQMHFNVMSWIRLVILFWTSQPHFIYLVHSKAGLQSKLCGPYSTEDNLYIILNIKDLIQSVCGTWICPGRQKSQIYIRIG